MVTWDSHMGIHQMKENYISFKILHKKYTIKRKMKKKGRGCVVKY